MTDTNHSHGQLPDNDSQHLAAPGGPPNRGELITALSDALMDVQLVLGSLRLISLDNPAVDPAIDELAQAVESLETSYLRVDHLLTQVSGEPTLYSHWVNGVEKAGVEKAPTCHAAVWHSGMDISLSLKVLFNESRDRGVNVRDLDRWPSLMAFLRDRSKDEWPLFEKKVQKESIDAKLLVDGIHPRGKATT